MAESDQQISIAQDKALTSLTIFSSSLSVIGSSLILMAVTRRKNRGPYERLMFGMSVCDIFSTLNFATQTFLTPRGTWALSLGNDTSCVVGGIFFQAGMFTSMIYYNMLAIFFLLTIRYSVSQEFIEKRLEFWMHAISLAWPIGTSIAGIFVEHFAPLNLYQGCWRTGSNVNTIAWVFVGPWLLSSYTIVPIIFVVIYRGARNAYRGSLLRQSSEIRLGRLPYRGMSHQAKRLQILRGQACLYVMAFFATYSFVVAVEITEAYSAHPRESLQRFYPLLVLESLMTPLAGFFNSLVFLRPRYLKLREQYKHSDSNASAMFLALKTIRCLSQSSLGQQVAHRKENQQNIAEPIGDKEESEAEVSLVFVPCDLNSVTPEDRDIETALEELALQHKESETAVDHTEQKMTEGNAS